ncbi:MAG TPA: hypothetical protein VHV51_04035 [Polyangiaceae bacterium]|nr:hypothetical protein [Polyangiaceae bacterium]
MASEPALHLPAKAKLSWRISRLRLAASGTSWLATGSKGGRVAVIELPALSSADQEDAWLAQIEASFEAQKFDPLRIDYRGQRG